MFILVFGLCTCASAEALAYQLVLKHLPARASAEALAYLMCCSTTRDYCLARVHFQPSLSLHNLSPIAAKLHEAFPRRW